ncbi:hypothetical protein AVEN_27476-1 [Araneus ventricosus]|uniref:DUF659 domain-containing protein n=1 Tax=Araneus ventricosus TaxID=182803 RepID=A0A4Y2QV79_ARAVE|nr:hypothetical protein AVEN_271015-1 [Araneus ventricosus]GBN67221.1 hypothetical protein AVEN_27476-1 [Araneus ventricosus]
MEEKRREKNKFLVSTSSAVSYMSSSDESIKEVFASDESNDIDISCHFPEKTQNEDILKRALNVRDAKEERLPIIVSFGDREQLIGVPKLQNATGKEQAHAVWIPFTHWFLETNVQILCSDTTASNTGCLNGARILLEQTLNREMLFLPCRHHIYELVLRSVFESKICEVPKCPDIPLFQDLTKNWKNININNSKSGKEHVERHFK